MSESFLGEIKILGFNFAPRSWAFCQGQLLPISQNDALFSLLGTMYGGDGRTTFGLPDLRGRMPMGQGSGSGLTPRQIGRMSGAETKIKGSELLKNQGVMKNQGVRVVDRSFKTIFYFIST